MDGVGATRFVWSVAGCAPMSASKFAVACCMFTSSLAPGVELLASRPHAHCTVPAPNTSAPEGAG